MLPWYVQEYKPKTTTINFEAAKEILMTTEKPWIENRRFDRVKNMIACKLYMKNEDIPENKEIFVDGFKQNKKDKNDNFILKG